jgi:deoxyribodipyrimidine photo-lyase
MADVSIYWFRDDLRLTDLPGLQAAANAGPVLPVFVLDPDLGDPWILGGASRWWLHHSLKALQAALSEQGQELILRTGKPATVLATLAKEINAKTVHCSRQYQPWAHTLEVSVRDALADVGATLKRFPGTLLHEPEDVATGGDTPFKVFTPFWRACNRRPEPALPAEVPTLSAISAAPHSEDLRDWHLTPSQPNWAYGWNDLWTPGETGAQSALSEFLSQHVINYGDGRDIPAEPNTSRLSPYLRFGNLSPRQVWHAAQGAKRERPETSESIDKFLSEIGWREFCYHLLFHFPTMPDEAFNPKFSFFPWGEDAERLKAWQAGKTGYPIVDAGMRELWHTGFMHNRVRMVVASFLTKHLLLNWREGEAWFWDCLLDADLASNACSWQWVGGSGADASPYFRIFNPIAQGEKFDKSGGYTRRWVPELSGLPDKYLHKPWEAPDDVLLAAGVSLGETYPEPIVDHKTAREEALSAYATLKALD